MRVNANLESEKLEEKFEKVREFTKEETGKTGKAEAVRTSIRIAYKKIDEWEKQEENIVKGEYKKLKREIERTLEGA